MNVVRVAGEIAFVTNQVLPEAPLPKMVFAAPILLERNAVANEVAGKACLDRAPTAGIVGIVRRQGPHRVEMIGKNDDRLDDKRAFLADLAERIAQTIGMSNKKIRPPVAQRDSEEIRGAWNAETSVVDHS